MFSKAIPEEKVLALLASEHLRFKCYEDDKVMEQHIRSTLENIQSMSFVYGNGAKRKITKVAPYAVLSLIDSQLVSELSEVEKVHVAFLRELMLEKLTEERQFWEFAKERATFYELQTLANYIDVVLRYFIGATRARTRPEDVQETTDAEMLFFQALLCFLSNNDAPHTAMRDAVPYGPVVCKLVCDMCFASYGMAWAADKDAFVRKHQTTYTISKH